MACGIICLLFLYFYFLHFCILPESQVTRLRGTSQVGTPRQVLPPPPPPPPPKAHTGCSQQPSYDSQTPETTQTRPTHRQNRTQQQRNKRLRREVWAGEGRGEGRCGRPRGRASSGPHVTWGVAYREGDTHPECASRWIFMHHVEFKEGVSCMLVVGTEGMGVGRVCSILR